MHSFIFARPGTSQFSGKGKTVNNNHEVFMNVYYISYEDILDFNIRQDPM